MFPGIFIAGLTACSWSAAMHSASGTTSSLTVGVYDFDGAGLF